ncbi:MAG: cupin domain-containing protein [Fibrobacterota bacterium]|nr:MAG: cupin domain-containing protein [Fibrobacterota bacterium]
MSEVIDRDNAEHYVWGGSCDGWHHLSRQDLSAIQERIPPGLSEVRHYHQRARQLFFCLSGTLSIELDGTPHRLAAEQSLEVPPGLPHSVSNQGDVDAWFLVISSPATKGDRIETP